MNVHFVVSNSNLSKMPGGQLWGSSVFNMTPVYFTEKQSLGDSVKHFELEVRGTKVGEAILTYTEALEARKAMVGTRKPIGMVKVHMTSRIFGASQENPKEQVFDLYSRIAVTSGRVVQYLRNQKGESVETEDAF